MLAPGGKDVKVETDENKIKPEWVEAVPLKKYADSFHKGVDCRFFLLQPKMSETPSAYFAAKPHTLLVTQHPDFRETPNMQYMDLVVQSTAGVTLCTDPKDLAMAEKLAPLAAVVEDGDTIMGFTIRVLVNCVPLKKGDLLTKPLVEKAKRSNADVAKPVTSQQLLKKMRHR